MSDLYHTYLLQVPKTGAGSIEAVGEFITEILQPEIEVHNLIPFTPKLNPQLELDFDHDINRTTQDLPGE